MAVCATKWTVLPHDPIEVIDERVWRVEGVMESGLRRTQTLVRLEDGRILVHNAIALRDEEMAKIDAWGEVAAIIVPNAFHRMDCRIMQERYPKARVYAPRAGVKKVSEATEVHGTLDEVPTDSRVRVRHLPGLKDWEGVIEVQGDNGLITVFNDALTNVAKAPFFIDLFVGPTGQVSVPRFARWLYNNDKAALRGELERISRESTRVIPGHGADLVGDVAERMREAIALV